MMDRVEIRKQIETLHFAGHNSHEIVKILSERHGSKCPCLRTVQKWISRVKMGDKDLKDSVRSGRPAYVMCDSNIEEVKKAVNENPKISLRNLSAQLNISAELIRKILTRRLGLQKLAARWVPSNLNDPQKCVHVQSCRDILKTWEKIGLNL